MANITLNIAGDLNIFVDGETGEPECLCLDGSPDTLEILLDVTDGDDEGNAAVLYAVPGLEPVPMTLFEALKLMLDNDGVDSAELLPAFDLLIAFNSDDVILCDEGCYLAGPGIIFAVDEGEIVPLDETDMAYAHQLLVEGLAKVTNGRQTRLAYGL